MLGEFDGKIKYHRFRREGETIEEAVLREKRREEMLCELTDSRMIRFIWADWFTPERTADRLSTMLRRTAA